MYEVQYIPLALPFFLFLVGLFFFIVVLIQLHVPWSSWTSMLANPLSNQRIARTSQLSISLKNNNLR